MVDRSARPSPDEIEALELPEGARRLCERYEECIDRRPDYLWKWLYATFPRYRLSSVASAHGSVVREQKLLLTMFYTALDDVADTYGDGTTFLEALKLPLPGATPDLDRSAVDTDALRFVTAAWDAVTETLGEAPRAEEFYPTFRFDLQQVLNAMHYGYLVTESPELATRRGTDAHAVHNMAQFSYADLDLMYSPGFDRGDLRALRRVVWPAQRLARIANWVATWEREVAEADPTSGILVDALVEDVVRVEELTDPATPDEAVIERVRDHGIEHRYVEEWERIYERLRTESHEARTVDLDDYVAGMADVRDLYLDSRGRI
ncbi:hypothetical protein [Haloarcula litorea]|uniref:hypothetical protein n=1 Tax=Haloarcula litorea TaxID=3032579 RepID=UPI0023E8B080|nr:hypothetical protein [Halomicroarcula sp. GDY20]